MSNHLINETSPYLLQHAENPVDWYPWCGEAFERAKREDKPIFLSIGYSTCHWCHVMAHESFENSGTAAMLNKYFISIKVDREERPDIDSVYMSVCQAFTGSGGWPMSIFMTWDKRPFFAGTYFPVYAQRGMPGFSQLLQAVAQWWSDNREALLHSADEVIGHLTQSDDGQTGAAGDDLIGRAVRMFSDSFDEVHGGFGEAPKFPTPHNLLFLTLYAKHNEETNVLHMVEKTLKEMRKGGIFDQIGGGFSRYSTDPYFLAPHFEKMLYDNALLIIAYTAVYAVTKRPFYLESAERTAQYVLREMTAPGGAFYSAQDADSEGVEGKYYTFTLAEILDVLGEERGKAFAQAFDITEGGNFEGVNIPNLLRSGDTDADFRGELQALYDYRRRRFRLHLDDKILLSWNAMMIAALSVLSRVSQKERYLAAAKRAQAFLEKNLCEDLRLYTSWREGRRAQKGFLDDYAYAVAAWMELYHTTLDGAYLEKAERLCMEAVRRFSDEKNGGFYLSDATMSELFLNPKECYDGAVPSGNSVMAYNFIRLYQLTGEEAYRKLADRQMRYLSAKAGDYLMGHSMFLLAKLLFDRPPRHVVVALKNPSDLERIRRQLPLLANVVVVSQSETYPLINDETTFYVCKDRMCAAPTNTLEFLREN